MDGVSTASRLQSHYEETVDFLPLSPQKFMVLIWLTSEGWKVELTLELPFDFELGTTGLGIQDIDKVIYISPVSLHVSFI